MVTSTNGNIVRVTGILGGEFTGQRGIPRPKGQWRQALEFALICAQINGWVNNREAGDLGHNHAHYDVIVKGVYSLGLTLPHREHINELIQATLEWGFYFTESIISGWLG